jgi:hypothetical protein
MEFILVTWLQIITGIMSIVGWAFDHIIGFALDNKKFSESCKGSDMGCLGPTISTLWRFIRDLGNIVIVFSMLYLAIRTILDGEGFADKKKLANVLLAAVLINFSLLFTKAAFTISNEVALEIRQQIKFNAEETTAGNTADTSSPAGAGAHKTSLSEGIARTLGIPKTINYISDEGLGGSKNLNDYQGIQFQYMLVLTFSVIGVSFILVAGAAMLLYRFIVFIFLMILAPLGLVCFFIPWLKKHGDKWVDMVKALTLLAPVYFLSFYVSMLLLSQIVALGTVKTEGFMADLVQMVMQVILIFLPVKASAAGGEFIGNVGKWTEGKIRSMRAAPQKAALWGARKSGQVAASGLAQTGRYLGGNLGSRIVGGSANTKKKLQAMARDGNIAQRAWAKSRLRTAEGLQNRTYDFRNVGGVGKKLGIGTGIKNWEGAVKDRKETLEKKQKDDMKRYGYDKMGDSDAAKLEVVARTAERDAQEVALAQHKRAYSASVRSGASQDILDDLKDKIVVAQTQVENKEEELGRQKNIGMQKHYEKMEQRWRNRMTPVRRAALEKMKKEMEKKFKEDGKSKKNRNSSPPPTPPPTPPPGP